MDIIAQNNGVIYQALNVEEINEIFSTQAKTPYFIEIPITFLGIENGPKSLNNISIERIFIGSNEYTSITNPSFHTYKTSSDKITICDENIGDSFKLKDDKLDNSNSTVVFKSLFDDPDNLLTGDQMPKEIEIKVHLTLDFQNTQSLQLIYKGEINNFIQGTISESSISRRKSIFLTQINLIGLIIFIGALSFWNFGWNRNIYLEKSEFFSHEFFTATIGILATFLGLSLRKIKSFFTVFTNTISFFKFPELHLSLEQFRGLSTTTWSIMLVVLVSVSGYFVSENWSVSTSKLGNGFKVYDTSEGQIVQTKRLYYSALSENNRFWIINNDSEPFGSHIKIGSLEAQGVFRKPAVVYDTLRVELFSKDRLRNNYPIKNVASNLLKNSVLAKDEIPITKLLASSPNKINNYTIEYFPKGIQAKETILVKDYKLVDESSLKRLKASFGKKEFKTIQKKNKYIKLYRKRETFKNQFISNLEEELSYEDKIEVNTLVELTKDFLINDVKGSKVIAMERYILLSGLWEYILNDDQIGKIDDETIKEISDVAYQIYERNTDWLIARMSVDFLMTFQKNLHNQSSVIPLTKINEFLSLNDDKFNIVDLIFIASNNEMINNEIISNYIINNMKQISIYNTDTNMLDAILKINKSNRREVYDYLHDDTETIKRIEMFCQQPTIKNSYQLLNNG